MPQIALVFVLSVALTLLCSVVPWLARPLHTVASDHRAGRRGHTEPG